MKGRNAGFGRWLAGVWGHAHLMLAAACLLATGVLVWTGYRAAEDLRDRTSLVLEQAADQTLALLVERLAREMRGANLLLAPMGATDLDREHVTELTQTFTQGLDTYAYVDAFFGWIDEPRANGAMTVVSRTDRPVAFVSPRAAALQQAGLQTAAPPSPGATGTTPVRITHEPALKQWLLAEIEEHGGPYKRGTRVYERVIDGHPYQLVVRLFFRGPERDQLFGILGYATDLTWVRANYFSSILDDFSAPTAHPRDGHRLNPIVAVAIRDDRGRTIASRGPAMQDATSRARKFRLAFLDADRLFIPSPQMPPMPQFEAVVGLADRSASAAASRIATGTHRILQVAACAILLTVFLFVRLVQRQAELVSLRASFVSRVTHELKTPLSLIKVAVETLQMRRVTEPRDVDEYYGLLQQEATRLERLINSVLRFAERDMPRRAADYQALDVRELVRETLARLEMQLHELGFRVSVSFDEGLPKVWADAAAIEDVLDNLVQNAIKFSPDERVLTWTASHLHEYVEIRLTDRGIGIAPEDGKRIFEPFVRGSHVTAPGHGLGLAIVRQVMTEHRGYVRVESPDEGGTTFVLGLPVAVAP